MSKGTIGARLKEALAERGMSMTALSEGAGLPYNSVQNYAADRQMPGSEALIKIRQAAGISIDWLLTGEGDKFVDTSIPAPRELTLQDYRELRVQFTNFDEVFQFRNFWEIPGVKGHEDDFFDWNAHLHLLLPLVPPDLVEQIVGSNDTKTLTNAEAKELALLVMSAHCDRMRAETGGSP